MRIQWNKYILGSGFSLQILPSSLSLSVSPSPSRRELGRRARAGRGGDDGCPPTPPPSLACLSPPFLPPLPLSPLPSRCYGRREATAGARRRRPCGRCAAVGGARRPPPSPPSSVRPPQRLLPLGSLCSFARRNPRCLCGGGNDGEARRLDLTVTHPLLLLLRPMAPPLDPLSLVFFWSDRSSQ